MAYRTSKQCGRNFPFAEWDGKDKALEMAIHFEKLVNKILNRFQVADKSCRTEMLEQHKMKAKKTIAETRDSLHIHLCGGCSPWMEKELNALKFGTAPLSPCLFVYILLHTYY